MNNKIIDINKKSFFSIVLILFVLMIFSIIITYIIPKGMFESVIDANGNIIVDYNKFIPLPDDKGINIFKGLFSFILVLFSKDGLSLLMLCLFLLIIAGAFQVMNDNQGMKVIVNRLINKFKDKHNLLICLMTLVFMMFGSFFGLFEEVLTLLPLIIMITLTLGYDSYLGFLICIIGTGFGFACAITNPFTVITASNIIGANPMANLWFRILIFILMYGLLMVFIFNHIKKIKKDPTTSPTFTNDALKINNEFDCQEMTNENKIFNTYIVFLSLVLLSIITITSIPSLRGYTVVFLTVIFLIGGIIAGLIINKNFKITLKSFLNGVVSALPTILLVLMASSIKYILEEGNVIATIANSISKLIENKNIFTVSIIIYLIILVLEFFISSSTAKSIFIMGILSLINIELSKELLVLIFVFGDGFTNVLLPTSPVLLISLSMINMNYFTWLKKSKYLFIFNFLIVILLIFIAILIKY